MHLWERLCQLPEEYMRQVQLLYSDQFPLVVRSTLAAWIEEKPWYELDDSNVQHESYALTLVNSLIREIQMTANQENNFVIKVQLNDAAQLISQQYSHNPFGLIHIVKQCLQMELKLIEQIEGMNLLKQEEMPPEPEREFTMALSSLRSRTSDSENSRRTIQQEQEQFCIQYQELQKRTSYLAQLGDMPGTVGSGASGTGSPSNAGQAELVAKLTKDKQLLESTLKQQVAQISRRRLQLLERLNETLSAIGQIQQRLLGEHLVAWRRSQQLTGNGRPSANGCIEQLQEWCEALAEMIWQNRQQVERVEQLCAQLPLQQAGELKERALMLRSQYSTLLSTLVHGSFVIEKQPPQVMKTNTRFTSTVRLLVGVKLNVHMTPPLVKVAIISESQANTLIRTKKLGLAECSGEILNNAGAMEYNAVSRQLSLHFRNMQLKKIKRAEKKGTESVMDEKFALLFHSQFKIGTSETFDVWTLSLPVVVIVHGNQEPHAWATVTWDNAFAEPNRLPFVIPEKMAWSKVGEVLSMKFKATVGRELNPDCLRFLAGKAFRNGSLPDYDTLPLSWSQFSKEPIPDRSFTFWEWFYAILKVTKEHMAKLWADDLVIGFIGKKQAEDLLLKSPIGTFLLRYSDSELGGVTIAWHGEGQDGQSKVFNLQPFTNRDFAIRSLADRIHDLKHLLYLYADRPKDQAFGKYYTPINENQMQPNGYVTPVLVTQIPGLPMSTLDSYPNTPQSCAHQNPQSPNESIQFSHDNSMSVQNSSSSDHNFNAAGENGLYMDCNDISELINMEMNADDMSNYDPTDLHNVIGNYDFIPNDFRRSQLEPLH